MMSPKVCRWNRLDLGPIAARLRGDLNRVADIDRKRRHPRKIGAPIAERSNKMAAQGRTTRRRDHKARLRGGAAIAVIARGSARDHCPITASKIPVTSSKIARRRIRRSLVAR
jgi:hypothetical protein